MSVKVTIVTVNWNSSEETLDFLKSLEKLKIDPKIELDCVVVDNGSGDDSVSKISEKYPKLNLVKLDENLGFSGGYNYGIKKALEEGADYCLVINNDTLIEDGQLVNKLLEIAEKDSNIGIITPKIHFALGYEFHKDRYQKEDLGKIIWYAGGVIDWDNVYASHRGVDEVDKGQYDQVEETQFCTGCCMFISKEFVEKVGLAVGLFDEKFFAYLEDLDLSLRTQKNTLKLIYAGNTSIWHKTSRSAGGSGSPLQDYFITRNRLILGMRYASMRTKLALLRETFRFLFSGREFQKLAVKDFFRGDFGKGSFFENYQR